MIRPTHPICVAAIYTVVILCVFALSGRKEEKTLYDKYLISLEGAAIPMTNSSAASEFYAKVLDFAPFRPDSSQRLSYQITGKKKLFLEPASAEPVSATRRPALVIRVRNGFDKLYRDLRPHFSHPPIKVTASDYSTSLKSSMISEKFDGPWGEQFVVSDPDGNLLLFYRTRLRFFGK